MSASQIFKETYENYVALIGKLDLAAIGRTLGFEMESDKARITCFNRTYWVGSQGIYDRDGKTPDLSVSVILFKYLLMCPGQTFDAQDLVTFKDFKDAAPLVNFFSNTVQGEIASRFQGDIGALENACNRLGGRPYAADLSYQIKYCTLSLQKSEGFRAKAPSVPWVYSSQSASMRC